MTLGVLEGGDPFISKYVRALHRDPYPSLDKEGYFKPLYQIRSPYLHHEPTHAVLSTGGNDIREILADMHKLDNCIKTLAINYKLVVEDIIKVIPSLILQM